MGMFKKAPDTAEITVAAKGCEFSLHPTCAIQLTNLAGSRVRLKARSDYKTVDCEIAIPESKEPIFRSFSSDEPESYALRSGRIPSNLESYIYDIRVQQNGSL